MRQPQRNRLSRARAGFSLIEVIVSLAVGSIVLVILGSLIVGALRSFVALGNYSSLDARNRLAVDKMTRDMRAATAVTAASANSLTVVRLDEPVKVKYTWYGSDVFTNTLVCDKTWQGGKETTEIYLTGCESWNAALYKRDIAATNGFSLTTNATSCEMVEFSWKCSRDIKQKKSNTEGLQIARIVLRNKAIIDRR